MIPLVFRDPSAKRNSGIWEKNTARDLTWGQFCEQIKVINMGGVLFFEQLPLVLLFTSSVQIQRVYHEDFQQTTPHGVYAD